MKKKQVKIEDLAVMIKNGFDQTATKQELQELRKDTAGMFDLMMREMRDVKITLGPLARTLAAHDVDIINLHRRVERLEKRVGSLK